MTASPPATTRQRLAQLAVPLTWRLPLTFILLALTVVGVVVNSAVVDSTGSGIPIDFGTFGKPGADVVLLQWGSVFENSRIQAGPLELAYWGISYLLGVHGHTAWLVVGIVTSSVSAVALAAVAERLLRALTAAWSIPLALGITAVAACSGQLASAFAVGHPSEVAVPLLWLIAAALARRGNAMAAAAVLASTTGWELWGILGAPVLLLAPRIDSRAVWRSAVGGVVVIAALFVPFLLLGPFHMFEYRWHVHDNSLAHLLFPTSPTFAWPLRLVQGVLALGAGTAAAVLLKRRPDAIWMVPLLSCIVRLLVDPVLAHYYTIPPFLLLLVGAAFSLAQRAWIPFLICLISVDLLMVVPPNPLTMAIALLFAAVMIVVKLRPPGRSREPAVTIGVAK